MHSKIKGAWEMKPKIDFWVCHVHLYTNNLKVCFSWEDGEGEEDEKRKRRGRKEREKEREKRREREGERGGQEERRERGREYLCRSPPTWVFSSVQYYRVFPNITLRLFHHVVNTDASQSTLNYKSGLTDKSDASPVHIEWLRMDSLVHYKIINRLPQLFQPTAKNV